MPYRRRTLGTRKSIDREATREHIFIGMGEVSINDRDLVTRFMARIGINGAFLTPEQWQTYLKRRQALPAPSSLREAMQVQGWKFTDITAREQLLTLEHFDSFRAAFLPRDKSTKGTVTQAFNDLVDPQNKMNWIRHADELSEPPQPQPGIVVISRRDADITPYHGRPIASIDRTNQTKHFAIEAGSLIDFGQSLNEEFVLSPRQDVLVMMSNQLLAQLAE